MIHIGESTGHDANGAPVPYFYVTCKKFRREFDTEDELKKWIVAYSNNDLQKCLKYGKLTSTLSEID